MADTHLDRIAEYADDIHKAAQTLRTGDLSAEAAGQMLVDAMCLKAALTTYLMRCDLHRKE